MYSFVVYCITVDYLNISLYYEKSLFSKEFATSFFNNISNIVENCFKLNFDYTFDDYLKSFENNKL
jgi:hypothetical protein